MEQDHTEAEAGATGEESPSQMPTAANNPPLKAPSADESLSEVLESTLRVLNEAIDRLESIVTSMEAGEADWDESVRLLAEANELAVSSSQRLDRMVQDVVYGGAGGGAEAEPVAEPLEGFQDAAGEAPGQDKQES